MSGTVNIVFIRHGISIANIYKKKEKKIPQDEKFRNAPLDQSGIEQITQYRESGDKDEIFSSIPYLTIVSYIKKCV